MSRLFEDHSPETGHEPEPESLTSSILWMLFVRTSGMLIVAAIMGLLIYRHRGRDNDDYPVWRAAAPSAVLDSYGIDRESVSVKEGDLKGLLCSPNKDISTLKDLLLYAADKHKGARALGQRKLIKEHRQKKVINGEEREWTLYEKSPYEWLTYSQVLTQVKQLSCGILALGIRPQLPVATAYASLGKKGLSHALSQTESRALFTHASLFKTVLKSLKKCETLQYVFYVGEPDEQEMKELEQALTKRVQKAVDIETRVLTFDKLIKIGKYNMSEAVEDPSPDDIALVMYTSGATGTPKGVLLSHANFVASVAGYASDLEGSFDPTIDKYLAYLPLAHVLEFTVEQFAIYLGIPIGYGVRHPGTEDTDAAHVGLTNPRSLTDSSMKNCKGDAKELQPTIMAGVPEVFERIRKTVEAQVNKQGLFAKYLFRLAYAFRSKLIEYSTNVPFLDQLAFRKVKQELGGKLNFVASGAAPLSKNNQMFLRAVMVRWPALNRDKSSIFAPLRTTDPLTETAGAGTLQAYDDPTFSNVGRPNMCCEIKLVDAPKMGYTTDDEEGPAGEILIRGPNVSRGYLKLDDKTKEDFKNGWFSTGDIGRWIDGRLYIVDRKKNLVKLSSGEYIALEKLETLYKESSLVENVMIHADTEENVLIAVVQPSKKAGDDEDAFKKEFEAIAKKNSLSKVERIGRVILDPEPWTPENGLVTATAKLNRQELEKKFESQLEGGGKGKKKGDGKAGKQER
ncbi:AMPbinding enzyme, putative [Acanthamoeba castellanii str. Neff]|uniref:AMPbinding enzyme, putative n=1 Tax=Acanthamoeba castellanii (strain ATCC 30010 / Neff) TaxID=1257118 RepID=L8GLT0_ACACF|nr:AMPbinding enzyme, putative [Acanthamoeba castellanii str. Neff]ELR13668.1 AMPbinding enzyme, putative [Acanthamoeba castellanii str. Neff]